jgi:hypothetical protein
MTTDFDRIFSQFDNADPTQSGGGGSKITIAGKHKVRVTACKLKESEQGNQVFFIAEYELLESNVARSEDNPNGPTAGTEYSWTCDVTRKFGDNLVGMNDVAAFLAAATGHDPAHAEGIGGSHLKSAVGDKQPLKGREVLCVTIPKVGKQSGQPWTKHVWSPA